MKAKLKKESDGDYILILNNPKEYPLPLPLLSLKNCQAIERGYNLDDLAMEECNNPDLSWENDYAREKFKAGFQKALELMGDKKFSEEDIHEAYSLGERREDRSGFHDLLHLKQQSEWDVEIEMVAIVSDHDHLYFGDKPKLDADGCLILKLKSE